MILGLLLIVGHFYEKLEYFFARYSFIVYQVMGVAVNFSLLITPKPFLGIFCCLQDSLGEYELQRGQP